MRIYTEEGRSDKKKKVEPGSVNSPVVQNHVYPPIDKTQHNQIVQFLLMAAKSTKISGSTIYKSMTPCKFMSTLPEGFWAQKLAEYCLQPSIVNTDSGSL